MSPLVQKLRLQAHQSHRWGRQGGMSIVEILVGMAIGLAPVIGIPLPFFSYGGSSLWAFSLMVFVFLRWDAYRWESL